MTGCEGTAGSDTPSTHQPANPAAADSNGDVAAVVADQPRSGHSGPPHETAEAVDAPGNTEETGDDTGPMRLAILAMLAEWTKRDPDAAQAWSHLTPEDLPQLGDAD
jgi:hypothetical protein